MYRNPVVEEDLRYISQQSLPWCKLAGKVVLVTGAAGFLPAYMIETLLWLNEQRNTQNPTKVIGLVRNRVKAEARFAYHINRPDFRLLIQDVCEPLQLEGPIDYIIHAASQASPKFYGVDPVGTLSANVIGTYQLLTLAHRKQSRRLLFFSSGEVYGETSNKLISETAYGYLDPLNVRSCYSESKRMGENMVSCWNHQYGLSTSVVRPFHTYGPGMDLSDGRVFADFVADVVAGRDICMKSDGGAVRAFCYLADAVYGFFTVLLKGADAKAYNVGNDQAETSIIELAERLVALFPERGIKIRQSPAAHDHDSVYLKSLIHRSCPDISQIRSLGWEPSIGLDEGFRKTVRSFETWV